MTEKQTLTLTEFARHGGFLVPNDDDVRTTCRELAKMNLLRRQPFVDGNKYVGDPKAVTIAFRVTAKGIKVAGLGVK